MSEKRRFENYKKTVKKPDLTLEEYKARARRWQGTSKLNITKS